MTTTPERCPKCYGTNGHHNTLHERYGNGAGGNKPCPLDPKGTHPMTSNDSDATVEGPHMTTPHPGKRTPALTIPEAVTKVLIQRHAYKTGHLTVVIAGKGWGMDFTCTDAEVLTRIHEIAAAMEAVK